MTDTLRDRLGALVAKWRKRTEDRWDEDLGYTESGLARLECANAVEAALAAQPAPAVMGEDALPTGNNLRYAGLAGNAKWIKETATLSQIEAILHQRVDLFAERAERRTVAAESREERPFERVLQLHVDSSESMRETYRRTANSDMENWQEGFTEGVKRAIEVYGNWRAAINGAEWPARQPGESPT